MSSPGWYPDPSGQPNSFRYWDGQQWSQQTTSNPYVPPPSQWGPPPVPPPAPAQPQAPAQPGATQPVAQPGWQGAGHTGDRPTAPPEEDPAHRTEEGSGAEPAAEPGTGGADDQSEPAGDQQQAPQVDPAWGQTAVAPQQPAQPGAWGATGQPGPDAGQGGWVDAGQAPTQLAAGGPGGWNPQGQPGQPLGPQPNYAQFGDQPWSPGPGQGGDDNNSSKKALWLIVAAVVAIVLIVGGIVAAIQFTGDDDKDDAAKDDTSQSAEPSEEPSDEPVEPSEGPSSEAPSDEPTEEPTESIPTAPADNICTAGNPVARETHPQDGRVHGGGLSMPSPKGYQQAPVGDVYTFLSDVITLMREVQTGKWISVYALGAVPKEAAGSDMQAAAEAIVECMANSADFYSGMDETKKVNSEAIVVDGADAWSAIYEVTVSDPEVEAGGDTVNVVVVDTGDDDTYGVFATVVPLGDHKLETRMYDMVQKLKVD